MEPLTHYSPAHADIMPIGEAIHIHAAAKVVHYLLAQLKGTYPAPAYACMDSPLTTHATTHTHAASNVLRCLLAQLKGTCNQGKLLVTTTENHIVAIHLGSSTADALLRSSNSCYNPGRLVDKGLLIACLALPLQEAMPYMDVLTRKPMLRQPCTCW
jgi:hypothetical protein